MRSPHTGGAARFVTRISLAGLAAASLLVLAPVAARAQQPTAAPPATPPPTTSATPPPTTSATAPGPPGAPPAAPAATAPPGPPAPGPQPVYPPGYMPPAAYPPGYGPPSGYPPGYGPPAGYPPGYSPSPYPPYPYPYPYQYPYPRYTPAPQRPPPPLLPYVEGNEIPAGYHLETRLNRKLIATGAGLLGGTWLFSIAVASIVVGNNNGDDLGFGPLYAPVVGPFIAMGTSGINFGLDWGVGLFLIFDGFAQAAGAAVLITGLAKDQKFLVRTLDAPAPVTPTGYVPDVQLGLGRSSLVWRF